MDFSGGIIEDFSFTWYIMVPIVVLYAITLIMIWAIKGVKLNTRLLLTILTFTTPILGMLISLGVCIYLKWHPQKEEKLEQTSV